MNQRLPSLELVAREVESQRQEQLRHFESVDTKAGILLGFAGALIVFSRPGASAWQISGSIRAMFSALFALLAFLPRDFPTLDARALSNRYLTADEKFTTLHLLDTRIEMCEEGSAILNSKALRLKLSLGALALAVGSFAGSIMFG